MFSALLRFLFPTRCVTCGALGHDWCDECRASILFSDITWENALIATDYDDIMAQAIHAWKYEYAEWLTPYFANLMTGFNPATGSDLVRGSTLFVPIPLTKSRQRQRGYNQAELLARGLSRRYQIPVAGLLVKTRETPSQVGLSKKQRIENLRGSFTIREVESARNFDLKTIILVDDVLTTGATITECTRILKAAYPHAIIRAWILSSKKKIGGSS